MGVNESILHHQITHGIFDNASQMVQGIAQRAVDKGFTTLSEKQRAVIEPFMTQHCSGVSDPGVHHHDCCRALTGEALLTAYEESEDSENLVCESCRSERSYYAGLYAGNAEISDTANLLIFEACLAGFDVYVYGAVSENLFVPAI